MHTASLARCTPAPCTCSTLHARVNTPCHVCACAWLGMSKSIVVDMSFLIEGRSEDELPEQILGTARFNRLDVGKYRKIQADEPLGY